MYTTLSFKIRKQRLFISKTINLNEVLIAFKSQWTTWIRETLLLVLHVTHYVSWIIIGDVYTDCERIFAKQRRAVNENKKL